MRFGLYALALLAIVGGYCYALISDPERSYLAADDVEPETLTAILTRDALPVGFDLVHEKHGYQNLRPSGEATYGAQLFQNERGDRIAVEIIAIGSRWAGSFQAGDALCSQPWPESECDGQFNTYRYDYALPAHYGSAGTESSVRLSTTGARVRSDTFAVAGMRITVSSLARGDSAQSGALLQTNQRIVADLYSCAIVLADKHGVNVRGLLNAKRP